MLLLVTGGTITADGAATCTYTTALNVLQHAAPQYIQCCKFNIIIYANATVCGTVISKFCYSTFESGLCLATADLEFMLQSIS